MKKSFKRGIAIVAASAMALSVIGVGSVLRSKAADATGDGSQLVRDIHLTAGSGGELEITRNDLGNKQMGKKDSWTIFVYMCGSDLESYYGLASMDIREMIAAGENDNVKLVGVKFYNNKNKREFVNELSEKINDGEVLDGKLELFNGE